jgi:hypothetical protein
MMTHSNDLAFLEGMSPEQFHDFAQRMQKRRLKHTYWHFFHQKDAY